MKFPDFDTLQKMAKESPEFLDELLAVETSKILSEAPPETRRRLEGLQFQIDMQRKLAKNPVDSMMRIFNMMQLSFQELNEALAPFRNEEFVTSSIEPKNRHNATLLNFPFEKVSSGRSSHL